MRAAIFSFTLTLLVPAVGCVTADEALKVQQDTVIYHRDSEGLGFEIDGTPLIYGNPVQLPRLQEQFRYGISVVDTTPLPVSWRLDASPEGGVVVASLHGGSPLAHAGVRPLDRIERVGDTDVTSVSDLKEPLDSRRIELVIRKPNGERKEIEVRGSRDGIMSSSKVQLLSLVSWAEGNAGSGYKIGPAGILFNGRTAVFSSPSRTVARSEFGCLFDLFATRTETDLATGEERSSTQLLWLFEFGDDQISPPKDD